MKKMMFILLIFISCHAYSQDSLKAGSMSNINKDSTAWEQMFFTIAPRIGVGIHHNPFVEVGLAGIHVDYGPIPWSTFTGYVSMVFHQTSKKSSFDTYGVKLGIQSSWGPLMHGLEVKALFFERNDDVYFSYKLGLSLLDAINIEYAVNFSKISEDMVIRNRNQISVNVNLNKKLLKEVFE